MAPVVRISDETFAMLQQVAQPLVDTPDSAIRKALAVYLGMQPKGGANPPESGQGPHRGGPTTGPREFDPDSPPDLTHASFLAGHVDGLSVNKWNYLLVEAHARAFKALHSDLAGLQRASEAHIRQGETTESGFRPVKNCGFSVQGVESNKAWAFSLRLAKRLGFPIAIEFRWQQKDGAAFPGEIGRMIWNP